MPRVGRSSVPAAAARSRAAAIDVEVLMFGILAQSTGERRIVQRMPRDATLRDLLAALCERFGADFTRRVMRTPDAKASFCLISLDGVTVHDLSLSLGDGAGACVEIMLLPGQEGG